MPQDDPSDRTSPSDTAKLKKSFVAALSFTGLLWTIKLAESGFGWQLGAFGVYPQAPDGLVGIAWAPLIHGSWSHLLANTAPVLILGTALLYGYPRAARYVLPAIYLGTGMAVWLFGRPAFHFGASGLTFGAMFFVFTIGIVRWDRQAIALAMIVFFLYGSMIWGIFPGDPAISHETHFFSALIGVISAFVLKHLDPPRPRKRYSWEEEDNASSDETLSRDRQ